MARSPETLLDPRQAIVDRADYLEAEIDASMDAWLPGQGSYPTEVRNPDPLVAGILVKRFTAAGWAVEFNAGADGTNQLVLVDPQAKERAVAFVTSAK